MNFKTDREILELLGEKLKQTRLNKNLTQLVVAKKIGIDRATLSLIENGRNTTLLNFIKLIKHYGKLDNLLDVLYLPEYNVMDLLKLEKMKRKKASRS